MTLANTFPSASADRANVRLPDGLRDRLKEAAKANKRSMNAELISRLEGSFDTHRQIAPALADLLEQHIQLEVKARLRAIASQLGEQ